MAENWGALVKRYRSRHGLTQGRMATLIGVSQRTVSRWERGDDRPSLDLQRKLRDMGWEPPTNLIASIAASVRHSPFPRALSRSPRLRLQALSQPAIEKRPSVVNWVGRDLAPIATGILEAMLDDHALQRSIVAGDIACVLTTTRSVLRTKEHRRIGTYRTVITYFFHEGTLYSDAVSTVAPHGTPLGYEVIAMDDVV